MVIFSPLCREQTGPPIRSSRYFWPFWALLRLHTLGPSGLCVIFFGLFTQNQPSPQHRSTKAFSCSNCSNCCRCTCHAAQAPENLAGWCFHSYLSVATRFWNSSLPVDRRCCIGKTLNHQLAFHICSQVIFELKSFFGFCFCLLLLCFCLVFLQFHRP